MKKYLLVGLLLILAACGVTLKQNPLIVTIEAQSLPITKTLAWDDSDASITNYTVTQDGTVIGNPTVKTQTITITTVGQHTFGISATNLWGTSAATVLQVNVVLPAAASNVRVQ